MPARKPPAAPTPPAPPKRSHQRKANPLPAHRPPYVATDKDRLTVKVMVAGGIERAAIAAVIGIAQGTLRKHFRREIDSGQAEVDGRVVASLIGMATTGKNVHAAKWYTQARMGWTERIVVDDGKPAGTPMRVVIEYVGDPAPARVEASAPRSGSRLPDDVRRGVQLVG